MQFPGTLFPQSEATSIVPFNVVVVGVGEADEEAVTLALGLRLGVTLALGLRLGVTLALGLRLGVTLALGLRLDVTDEDALFDAVLLVLFDGVMVNDGDIVLVGVDVPLSNGATEAV